MIALFMTLLLTHCIRKLVNYIIYNQRSVVQPSNSKSLVKEKGYFEIFPNQEEFMPLFRKKQIVIFFLFYFFPSQIWKPDITFFNYVDEPEGTYGPYGEKIKAVVMSNGMVIYVPPIEIEVIFISQQNAGITDFPHFVHIRFSLIRLTFPSYFGIICITSNNSRTQIIP